MKEKNIKKLNLERCRMKILSKLEIISLIEEIAKCENKSDKDMSHCLRQFQADFSEDPLHVPEKPSRYNYFQGIS